jgi:hypothetical protein
LKNNKLRFSRVIILLLIIVLTTSSCTRIGQDLDPADFGYGVEVTYHALGGVVNQREIRKTNYAENSLLFSPAGTSNLLVTPVRDGYTVAGWYTDYKESSDDEGNTQYKFDPQSRWDFNTDRVQEDITLYARWVKKAEANYIDSGTDEVVFSKNITAESPLAPLSPAILDMVSKTGYTFQGYFYKDLKEEYDFSDYEFSPLLPTVEELYSQLAEEFPENIVPFGEQEAEEDQDENQVDKPAQDIEEEETTEEPSETADETDENIDESEETTEDENSSGGGEEVETIDEQENQDTENDEISGEEIEEEIAAETITEDTTWLFLNKAGYDMVATEDELAEINYRKNEIIESYIAKYEENNAENDVYLVFDEGQKIAVDSAEALEAGGKYKFADLGEKGEYTINNDLDFSGKEFSPLNEFKGMIDGQGHVLSNIKLKISFSKKDALGGAEGALLTNLDGAVIKNLTFKDMVIEVTAPPRTDVKVAALAVNALNSKIENVTFDGLTINTGSRDDGSSSYEVADFIYHNENTSIDNVTGQNINLEVSGFAVVTRDFVE